MSDPNLTPEHLECFLLEMSIDSSIVPHFDASWLSPTVLLKNKIYNIDVYRKLIGCGMSVTASCVEAAVNSLSKRKLELFKLLVLECPEKENLFKACEVATSLRRNSFIDVLKEASEV